MSNEYKDWLEDKIIEVVLESGVMDKIEKLDIRPGWVSFVNGKKNEEEVFIAVYFDDELCEWKIEHRELDK